jgi:hypothetical protein
MNRVPCPSCGNEVWNLEIRTSICGFTGCHDCIMRLPPRNQAHKLVIQAYALTKKLDARTYESYEQRADIAHKAHNRYFRRCNALRALEGRK